MVVEGAQDAIVNLPTNSILAGRPGQLGLGGAYFAANGTGQNNANGFVRQALCRLRAARRREAQTRPLHVSRRRRSHPKR